ncbi:hypothetical protein ABPG75_010799 [Micractinium tetrahymenae]
MSAPELALEQLCRARARLAASGGSSPELDWQIQSQQAILAARPELEAAAAALGPTWPVHPDADVRFPSSTALFKAEGLEACFNSTTVLQLLATGMLQIVSRNYGSALTFLWRGVDLLWPAAAPANRDCAARLAAAGWVPAIPAAGSGGGAGEEQYQQQEEPQPTTPLARAVAADLARHCPGTTFADLLRWAQTLLLSAALAHTSPSSVQQQRQLLCHSQQVLNSAAAGSGGQAAQRAIRLAVLSAGWAGVSEAREQAIEALHEAALEAAEGDECWVATIELALMYGVWSLKKYLHQLLQQQEGQQAQSTDGAQQPAREQGAPAWLLARLGRLEQQAQRALEQAGAARWVPLAKQRGLEDQVAWFSQNIAAYSGGNATSRVYPAPPTAAQEPRCACCASAALVLRACSGCRVARYCSKDCQTKHWKAGHRAECKRLAAEQAAG